MFDTIVAAGWGVLEGRRLRPVGINACLGAHGGASGFGLSRDDAAFAEALADGGWKVSLPRLERRG